MPLDWLHLSDLIPYKTKLSGDAKQVSKFSVGYLGSEQMASSRVWGTGRNPFEGGTKRAGGSMGSWRQENGPRKGAEGSW